MCLNVTLGVFYGAVSSAVGRIVPDGFMVMFDWCLLLWRLRRVQVPYDVRKVNRNPRFPNKDYWYGVLVLCTGMVKLL